MKTVKIIKAGHNTVSVRNDSDDAVMYVISGIPVGQNADDEFTEEQWEVITELAKIYGEVYYDD